MDKYYIGSNPIPAIEGYKSIKPEDVLKLSNSLILMTGTENYDILREYDEKRLIHLGLRNFRVDQLEMLPYARFNSNYLIFSREWDDNKYGQFKNFQPQPEIKYPEAIYVNIAKMTDEEAVSYVNKLNDLSQSLLGIDFETAGSTVSNKLEGFPEFYNFMPLGLSITDKEKGYYFDFEDYFETKESRPKFYEALKEFIAKNQERLMAFNVSFEIRCLFFMYHIFFELGDARAWCIVDERRENLKLLAQYYLGAESWDDENEAQMEGLAAIFKQLTYEETEKLFNDYKKTKDERIFNYLDKETDNIEREWAKRNIPVAFKLNLDNPDFLPRLKKYWGNTWACTNQKIMAKYCVIDAVMDIHITEKIRSLEFLGKKYTEDSYKIYLYNQYLSAQITSSAIHVDAKKRHEITDFYERLNFNSYIMVCQYYNYIIRELSEGDPDYIPVELSDKLRYIVIDLKSTFFVNPNPVKMAKEFAILMFDNWETHPELFETIITDHRPELSFLYELVEKVKKIGLVIQDINTDMTNQYTYSKEQSENIEKEWKSIFRKREKYWLPVYEILKQELGLDAFLTDYNERLLAKTDRNKKVLKYWSGTEEELVEVLKNGTLEQSSAPKNYHAMLSKYIWDKTRVCDPEAMQKTLKKYLIDAYIADFEKYSDRTLESPVDHKLDYLITYDFNSPKVRDELIPYFQKYFEIEMWKVDAFYDFVQSKGDMSKFSKENYKKFSEFVDSKCPDGNYERIPQIRKNMYMMVTDRDEKGKVIGEHEERIEWGAGVPTGAGYAANFWVVLQDKGTQFSDHPVEYDISYKVPKDKIDFARKFASIINVNRASEKVITATLKTIHEDSYNVVHDDTQHIRWVGSQQDESKELMYKINVHANSVHTKRWACLTGDTPILLADHSTVQIKDMGNYIGKHVYSYDIENKCYVAGKVTNWARTGINVPLVKVTFDNGQEIKCTPEHRFLRKSGEYVEAKDLKINDSIESSMFKYIDGRESMSYGNNWKYTHLVFTNFRTVNTDYQVHHKDGNKVNNEPDNLQILLKKDHLSLHCKEMINKLSPETRSNSARLSWIKNREGHLAACRKLKPANRIHLHNNARRIRYEGTLNNKEIQELYKAGKLNRTNHEEVKSRLGRSIIHWDNLVSYFGSEEEIYSRLSVLVGNARVISIQNLEERQDVYDIEVEKYHNFMIGDRSKIVRNKGKNGSKVWTGIIVHNSNFHTMPPKDDARLCLGFQEGYIGSYFDISQAEPRSVAYLSREPKFYGLYDSGKDAYRELAKMAFPLEKDDADKITFRRRQCKSILLSGLYGQSIKTLSNRLNIPYEDGLQIWNSFIGGMEVVKQFKDDLLNYALENGRVKTIIGDKISIEPERSYTSSMNYVIQGFTAVILATGFYNAVKEAVSHGINVSVKGVVHDSSTTEFPIRNVIHMDLHYRKYFREWIRHYWHPDYKYDLDLLLDLMHHISYNFDLESGIVNLNMWTGYVDKFLEHFSEGYKFKIEKREDIHNENYQGGLKKDFLNIFKTHTYMDGDYWRRINTTKLTLKLTEPLKDIDWYYKPFDETNQWDAKVLDYTKFK